jgi:hypothetical protein
MNKKIHKFKNNTIGIHWFNGLESIKNYLNNLNINLKFTPRCFLDKYIYKYYKNIVDINDDIDDINDDIDDINDEMDNNITIIINYSDQWQKLLLFFERMNILYGELFKINYLIITQFELNDYVLNYTKIHKINYKIVKSLIESFNNIETEYVIFQDIIVQHKINLISLLLNNINDYEVVCMNKVIENKNLNSNFKNLIIKNRLPDIICFTKKLLTDKKDFKLDMDYFNNNINYFLYNVIEIEYLFPKNIPKKVHFYWDGSKGCYLTKLALNTFVFHNPDWEVNLWKRDTYKIRMTIF